MTYTCGEVLAKSGTDPKGRGGGDGGDAHFC